MIELNLQYWARIVKRSGMWRVSILCNGERVGRRFFQNWGEAVKFAAQTVNTSNRLTRHVRLKRLGRRDYAITAELRFNDGWVGALEACNWKHLGILIARRVFLRALELNNA